MPINPTYPGVYIEEIPSGQHTITPAATNIAAFVGRAPIGPIDEILTCFSFGDFQRFYGGLAVNYPMSYAVQDFFNNGGSQAVICRLFEPAPGHGGGIAQLPFPVSPPVVPEATTTFSGEITFSPPLQLVAASPGSWANTLTALVDTNGITPATSAQFAQYDIEQEDLFNLTLQLLDSCGRQITSERYLNAAVKTTGIAAHFPNRLDHVLKAQSRLARVGVMPLVPPTSGTAAKGSGGNDGQNLSVTTYLGERSKQSGIYLLDKTPIFNLLCIPPDYRMSIRFRSPTRSSTRRSARKPQSTARTGAPSSLRTLQPVGRTRSNRATLPPFHPPISASQA